MFNSKERVYSRCCVLDFGKFFYVFYVKFSILEVGKLKIVLFRFCYLDFIEDMDFVYEVYW